MPQEPRGKNSARILIVDDDASQRSLLHTFLSVQGFQTTLASSGEEALRFLGQTEFDMMISDVRMPGISGMETMRRARAKNATLPILLVTAFADIREAVGAMRDGALNYLSKPIDLDELLASVRHALGAGENTPLKFDNKPLPAGVIVRSQRMQTVVRDASLIAPSESRVLITGESGSGKDLLADLIHAWSSRATWALVKVSCAATPQELIESELCGHEKGAFPGASTQRIGRFEEARNGTILLDEIGDLSLPMQAKLLRITQDGCFQRVGSSADIQTNVRILATTKRNIEEEVKNGRFREDLFYRLNVVELTVPPLRDRREDILPLASHFLAILTKGRSKLSPSAGETLEAYSWPGNARELHNAMERAALLSQGELILPEHLPSRLRGMTAEAQASERIDEQRLGELEEQAILTALRKHAFNRTDTAKALGISRRGLIYKLGHLRDRGYKVDPEP